MILWWKGQMEQQKKKMKRTHNTEQTERQTVSQMSITKMDDKDRRGILH